MILYQMISPHSCPTFFAIHHCISKSRHMPRCFPNFMMRDNTSINSYHVRTDLDEIFPPKIFDISKKFCTDWTVIIGIRQSTIQFRSWVDKTTTFCEGNYFIHYIITHDRIITENKLFLNKMLSMEK